MHPSVIRHIHASRIFHAIRLRPNMSQREIAAMTGADKSTVSAVIKDFEATGLIERTSRKSDNRPGRPGECIAISARGGLLIGIHLNPEGMQCVVSGLDGEPLKMLTRTMPKDPSKLGRDISTAIKKVASEIERSHKEVRAVGISIPGLVSKGEVLTQSPNLGWANVSLGEVLQNGLEYPFYVDNNANASAIAEYYFGRGVETGDFAYIESGSGVGAGLFLDGGVYRGVRGFAGEFGHTKIVPQGRHCRCGALGCVSAYTSDYAIYERLHQKGIEVQTREAVAALAEQGDAAVLAILDEAGRHLGIGLANIVNLLNIPLFILGGGFQVFAPFMKAGIDSSMQELALPSAAENCQIELSRIESAAIPLGGIALALEGCTSHHGTEATPW